HARRADRAGEAVLLRRLPGNASERDADERLRIRADEGDARRRLLRDHVARVQRRTDDCAARTVYRHGGVAVSLLARGARAHLEAAAADQRLRPGFLR